MIEIEIRGFQSIDHVTVRMEDFTAVVGRSNIGKSAIVRAVKAALTGASVDNHVRHGSQCTRRLKDTKTCKCSCLVMIKGDGFDLLWEKGDDVNRYEFNGTQYTAVNRGTPEFLQDTVGLVKVGDSKQLLQVADQFEPIFLFNQSGTVVADVLSDVAHLDQINVAARLVEKDRKEAAASRKVRDKDILELQERVASYDELDAAVARVQLVERCQRDIQWTQQLVVRLDGFITSAFGLAREVKSLERVHTIVIPESAPLEMGAVEYENLCRYVRSIVERETVIYALTAANTVALPDGASLREVGTSFTQLEGWLSRVRVFKEQLVRWSVVEKAAFPEAEPLVEASRRHQELAALTARHVATTKSLAGLEDSLETVAGELNAVEAEIDALGLCPTCTQPIGSSLHAHSGVGAV